MGRRRAWAGLAFLGAAGALAFLFLRRPPPAPARISVLLVTVDTLRPDARVSRLPSTPPPAPPMPPPICRKAARLSGNGFAHAGALGILLAQLGRADEARPWLAASRATEGDFVQARLTLARLEAEAGREPAARAALREAVAAAPSLRTAARAEPRLRRLLE